MPTPTKQASKLADFKALHEEASKLLDTPSQENIERVRAINVEMEGLKAELKAASEADGLKNSMAGHDAFLNTPAPTTFKHAGAAEFVGFKPAGETTITTGENGSKTIVDQGEGVLDAKTLQTRRDPVYSKAFNSYIRSKGDFTLMDAVERKALNEGTDTAGGFTVPEDFMARVIMKEPTPTRVADFCTHATTSRDALILPRVNYFTDDLYTTGIRVTWTGEQPASATTHRVVDPTFGQVRIPVYTAMMSQPLTKDLIEDAAFDLTSWAADRFRETIRLLYDNMVLNGTGSGQPTGILVNPGADNNQPAVVTSGNATQVTADGLVKLGYSLPEQYDTNARFVLNKTNTTLAIAQLKDAQNRYLFGMGYQDSGLLVGGLENNGRRLLGYPTMYSGFMPNIAANSYPVIFGDFSGYYLVNRIGFSIEVLRELYAETNQVLLLGRIRFGGQVAEPWKLKVHKIATP